MHVKRSLAIALGGALAACVLSIPAASAEEPPDNRPDFKLPAPCGQTWAMFTYGDHGPPSQVSKRVDMQRTDGETEGADVVASAAGKVSYVDPGGVHIDHGNGWFTQYLHMKDRVAEGKTVKEGDRIGAASHVSDDPGMVEHLHYQQMYDFDKNGYPTEGGDNGPDELVHPVIQGKEYKLTPSKGVNLKSKNNCDGGEPEPEAKETTLAYTGDESVSNGSEAELSAVLQTKDSDKAVKDRKVTFKLGSGDTAQTCTDKKTDAKGVASCTLDVADQELTDDGTLPLAATFAGDDAYKKSKDSAKLKLQHVEARSYGLSAEIPLPVLPVGIDPTPDTGKVRTAGAETESPACAQDVNVLVLNAEALCAEVTTSVGPSRATATATVGDVSIGLPGLPVIGISGVTSKSSSSCSAATGSVSMELTVAGQPVSIPDTPGFEVDLGVAGKLVVNEQTPVDDTDKGLTVNAVHLTTPLGADVVIGSSTSSAHDCA